jgi:WD40 repeat protein
MFVAKCKLVLALVLTLGALGAGAGVLTLPPPEPGPGAGEQPAQPAPKAKADQDGDPLPAGALARLGTIQLRQGHNVMTVAFAPDGKSLVSTGGDHLARRWDVATGRQIGSFGQQTDRDNPFAATRWLYAVAFAPDGKTLATGDHEDGWNVSAIRLWDAATGQQAKMLQGHTNGVLCVAYAPDGKTLASASADGTVRLWDPVAGTERHTLNGHQGAVRWVAYSRDGKRLASAGADGTVRLWDPDKGTEVRAITAHEGGANSVAFSPDGKRLVSGGDDRMVRLWESDTGQDLRKLSRDRAVRPVAFSPDGKRVACGGGWDVLLWDPDSGKEVGRLTGPANDLRSLAFSPDGKHLTAAAFATSTVFLWETETGKRLGEGPGHGGGFLGRVAYSADGRVITTIGGDGTVRQWEATTGRLLRRIPARQTTNRAAALTADGKAVAAGDWDGSVRVVDLTGKEQRRWKAHEAYVTALACSPDGKTVASAGNDRTVVLWDTAAGKELHRFTTENGAANGMTFSADGKLLAVVVSGQSIELREVASGERRELRLMPGGGIQLPGGGVASLVSAQAESAAFSADGRLLATGDRSGIARTWDLQSMQIEHPFTGHLGWIMAVALSPDGRTLAVGNWRNVRLWELSSGKERRRFGGLEGDVSALAFAPDGRTLVSGCGDTTALVWDLTGRLDGGQLRPANLSQQELELAWTDLRGDDAGRAYTALWSLAAAPKQALPLLRDALPRAAPVAADRLGQLVTTLDDDDFQKREKATDELARVGEQAEAALRKALEGKPSAELRRRVEYLLERMRGSADAERLRQERVLEVLEAMGTPEARGVLKELSTGAPAAWLTRQAKAALHRLSP